MKRPFLRGIGGLLILPLFLMANGTHSAWGAQPVVRFSLGGRANLRPLDSIHNEMVGRTEVEFAPNGKIRLLPFVEARRNLDQGGWSRVELGAECGVKPFLWLGRWDSWYTKPLTWFYVGEGFYERWFPSTKNFLEENHPSGKMRVLMPGVPHPEWKTRTLFEIPTPWKFYSRPLGLYALNEYFFDLSEGRSIRNETGVGVILPLPNAHQKLLMGWRHVDWIHEPDMDQFEGSFQLEF